MIFTKPVKLFVVWEKGWGGLRLQRMWKMSELCTAQLALVAINTETSVFQREHEVL